MAAGSLFFPKNCFFENLVGVLGVLMAMHLAIHVSDSSIGAGEAIESLRSNPNSSKKLKIEKIGQKKKMAKVIKKSTILQ